MSILKTRQQGTSRSSVVRQRREQTQSNRPSVVSRTVPPVVTRKVPGTNQPSAHAATMRPAVKTQSRRKVYYAVGSNGVETRMPAIPIIKFSWQWVSGLLTLGFLVLTFTLTNLPIFKVSQINLVGLQRVTVEDVYQVLSGDLVSAFILDKKDIHQCMVSAFSELKDIRVKVNLPDGITIHAVERQPIMAWKFGDTTYWIDAEGVVMSPRGEAGDLLRVKSSGIPPFSTSEKSPSSVVDFAIMVMEQSTNTAPEPAVNRIDMSILNAAIELSTLKPQNAQLVYDSISGIGWQDSAGWKVYFGNDLSNLAFKQMEYKVIVDKLTQMGEKPVFISVEHIDSPYYRVE